jgi:hypothetical protein
MLAAKRVSRTYKAVIGLKAPKCHSGKNARTEALGAITKNLSQERADL